jgi:hypothetical protein
MSAYGRAPLERISFLEGCPIALEVRTRTIQLGGALL